MVNLELYRVFYTVAKCGSLTKAAEELYISQPAVSQSIKQLENQLGVSLFNRTHRGMELSAQGGKVIFEEVEQALHLFGVVEDRIEQMKTSSTGVIRIGASDTIFEYFLADKIVDFHERFPAVKIELIAGFSPDTLEQLKTDRCDIAFVNLPISVDSDLRLHGNCMLLNDVFIAGEKFADLKENTLKFNDLTKYPLIMMDPDTVARQALDHFTDSLGVKLHPAIEVGSWDLMKRLVQKGMGIGVIPREYAAKNLSEGALLELKTDPTLPVRSIGMLLKKEKSISYPLHCFIDSFTKI